VGTPEAFDRARDRDGERRQQDHDEAEILDVRQLDAENVDLVRPDHIGAARAADVIPVHHKSLQHDRQRERCDREERAAQPQRQVAGAEADQAGHERRDDHQRRHRLRQEIGQDNGLELLVPGRRQIEQAVLSRDGRPELRTQLGIMGELVERDAGIGAECEERRGAEVHIAAIAAEDVPRGGEHDELQHRVAGEEQVVVAEGAREKDDEQGDADRDAEEEGRAHGLASQQSGRPYRQRQQQQAKGDGRRP
jgi:hypothetical protein